MTVNDTSDERRRFTRIHFDAQTEVCYQGEQQAVQLVDISFNGMLIQSESPLPVTQGETAEVQIHLGDNLLKIPVELAHRHNDHYGFRMENLDIDSATHLHRLVELNLGDEKLFERELEHLIPNSH